MKSHIKPTKKQIKAAEEFCEKAIVNSTARYGWIIAIALNDEFGFGKNRINKLMQKVNELANEYNEMKKYDIEEDVLLRRVKQIIPEIDKLYPND